MRSVSDQGEALGMMFAMEIGPVIQCMIDLPSLSSNIGLVQSLVPGWYPIGIVIKLHPRFAGDWIHWMLLPPNMAENMAGFDMF